MNGELVGRRISEAIGALAQAEGALDAAATAVADPQQRTADLKGDPDFLAEELACALDLLLRARRQVTDLLMWEGAS